MKIRAMKLSDFNQVYTLWQKVGLDLMDYQKEEKEFFLMLQLNPNTCLVGLENKQIIGSVLGLFNGKRGWIYHLAIHPHYQRRGYGTLLYKKAEEELKKRGAQRLNLGVLYTNLKILPFYEKCGYEVVNDALWLGKNI